MSCHVDCALSLFTESGIANARLVSAPYVRGSETSKAAADSMRPHVQAQERIVLRCIAASERGRTCDEVEAVTGLKHQAASARIKALKDDGLVRRIGKRPTRSGRPADVLVATAKGREVLEFTE